LHAARFRRTTMEEIVYEDARRVGEAFVRALGEPREVFAATRAVYDADAGEVRIQRSAQVLGDDANESASWLPAPSAARSEAFVRMRAIRLAVLAAMAWETRVARALEASGLGRACP
jgi:hypothetical protein